MCNIRLQTLTVVRKCETSHWLPFGADGGVDGRTDFRSRDYQNFSDRKIIRARLTRASGACGAPLLGSFSNDDGDGNEDAKKAIDILRKTTTLHVHHTFCTFIYRPCTTTT